MGEFTGKTYVVTGVRSETSICWAIAKEFRREGARVINLCQSTMFKRTKRLTDKEGMETPIQYDADKRTGEYSAEWAAQEVAKLAPKIYGLVHGIAASDPDQLKGRFVDTTLENFLTTMEISCYSLLALTQAFSPLMSSGGCISTLTFNASSGTYPNYNCMAPAKAALETSVKYLAADFGQQKIRFMAISPSPVDTLSGRGISNFYAIRDYAESMAMDGELTTLDEIAHAALYVHSERCGMNAEVMHVNHGASATRMYAPHNAHKAKAGAEKVLAIIGQATDDVEVK